jgi:hypothetical protein
MSLSFSLIDFVMMNSLAMVFAATVERRMLGRIGNKVEET